MKCLVTGGAGFIGRWVVERLLRDGHDVTAMDDLSNGRRENLREFEGKPGFRGLVEGDLTRAEALEPLFAKNTWDLVLHLGASIHVQKSIDDPTPTFRNDALGTFQVLEACRRQYFETNGVDFAAKHFDFDTHVPLLKRRTPRVAVMSTCMVYDLAGDAPIREIHPYRPASPYAAAKIAADMLALSYFHAYRMPVTVVRPFNTFGPFQKSNSEGGVVSIFLKKDIEGSALTVKGSGDQTRDLLYVEDCADFVVTAAQSERAEGRIVNAGTGTDISVNDLAVKCCSPGNKVTKIPHDHPQAEIMKLCCDASLAKELLGWTPKTSLEDGIRKTRSWLEQNRQAW
ncbi:MAG: GDP-mannose 4,6-dehydratase [Polyangiaceae bacterium]